MNLYLTEAVALTVFLCLGVAALQEWRSNPRRPSRPWRGARRAIDDAQRARSESLPSDEERRKAA